VASHAFAASVWTVGEQSEKVKQEKKKIPDRSVSAQGGLIV